MVKPHTDSVPESSLSDALREMVDKKIAKRNQLALAAAAQALLVDYQTDPELTAFLVLDRDGPHAQKGESG